MKSNKVRFLATGDLHSDLGLVKKITEGVDFKNIEFVVLIGDLSERDDDFKDLLGVFKDKKIFMVPGNHESSSQLEILKEKYNVHLVGNSPIMINEDLVLFGTNYIHIGPYGIPEEEVFENLVANYDSIKDVKCKVHLSHIPPHGTKIGDASPFAPFIEGSRAIRTFLDNFNPHLTLVGHIHESSGLEEIVNKTKVLNVGRTFKILEFDPKKKEVKIVN